MKEIIKTYAQLEKLKSEWDSVIDRCENRTIFMTYGWIHSFAKTILKEEQLFCIVLRKGDAITAIAPFFIENWNLYLIGYPMSDYSDLIIPKPDDLLFDELLNAISEEFPRWKKIVMDQVKAESSVINNFKNYLANKKIKNSISKSISCPVLDYRDYTDTQLSEHLNKKMVKRKINLMKREGNFEYITYSSKKEIKDSLLILFDQHMSRWGSSVFKDIRYKNLYFQLVEDLFDIDQITLSAILFNGTPITFIFCFKYNNNIHSYTNTFDKAFSQYSPGMVIFKIDNEKFCKGYNQYNFGRGMEEYKLRFANKLSDTNKMVVFHNSSDYLVHTFVSSVKSIVKMVIFKK